MDYNEVDKSATIWGGFYSMLKYVNWNAELFGLSAQRSLWLKAQVQGKEYICLSLLAISFFFKFPNVWRPPK